LDIGNPQELGHQYDHILGDYQHIKFLGGCCGTDRRHLAEIAKAGQEKFKTAA
jgi:methionine synthase I (cobalamin-dependent)